MTAKKIRTIEELGEFGLIDHLTSGFKNQAGDHQCWCG